MIDEKLLELLKSKSITNFIYGFDYLKNAGYNEKEAFFNSLELFKDRLVPENTKIVSITFNNNCAAIVYKVIVEVELVTDFIKFCEKNNFDISDFSSKENVIFFNDMRLFSYFNELCKKAGEEIIIISQGSNHNGYFDRVPDVSKYIGDAFGSEIKADFDLPF